MAPIFIRKNDDSVPCHKWSWSNQLIVALAGHDDARGDRQWQQVGRHGFDLLPLGIRADILPATGQVGFMLLPEDRRLLNRTCEAVALILDTAEQLVTA